MSSYDLATPKECGQHFIEDKVMKLRILLKALDQTEGLISVIFY